VRFNLLRDRVEIGPLSRFEFRGDEFTVDANFEGTAAGRDQLGIHARRFTNESGQPGRFWFVVSGRAVLDRYLWFHARLLHLPTLFGGGDSVEGGACFNQRVIFFEIA
jgi:hypothetical protein